MKHSSVALLVSAWIEIALSRSNLKPNVVALLVSAWIEIFHYLPFHRVKIHVALLVSAWIEIVCVDARCCSRTRRTPRECVD